jgi:hypothetical protein
MRRIIPTLFFLTFPFFNFITAQETTQAKEKISDAISQYFDLDRETIHAHFDKKIFLTNEEIWFKGYVFNKKNGTPFFETSNVYALLLDENGAQAGEQLLFSSSGTFSGSFKLSNKYKSGRYYIQFYTNWMNNFTEDESTVYPIQIINEDDTRFTDYESPDYSTINIDFHPEGGNFIEDTPNNLGISILDCNVNPCDVKEGRITNARGETIKNFPVNKSGYAKIYITPTAEAMKAIITVNGKDIEAVLPKIASTGIALEVNNYALPGKTIVKVRTNARTLATMPEKILYLVMHQNDKSEIFDIDFNDLKTEKELVIANTALFKGVNTVSIIDSNMHRLAERMIFEFPETAPNMEVFENQIAHDSIKVSGKSAWPNANLSIAVLPEKSISTNETSDIYGALLINPYLRSGIKNAAYYFSNPSKAKKYEFDLLLLNQKAGKYDWQDITSKTPGKTYNFDIGLTVKGSINQSISEPKKHRIQLMCAQALISDYSEINDKKEFYFQNLVFPDSSRVSFTLMKLPSFPVDMKFNYQVMNRKRTFNKVFKPAPASCNHPVAKLSLNDIPAFGKDVVPLEGVEVQKKVKYQMKYGAVYGNANLRGFKITELNNTQSLVSFINQNGFSSYYTETRDLIITSRTTTSVNAKPLVPLVYVNEREIMTFDELESILMNEVDEIFLNPHAIIPSIKGQMGMIKIYLKKLSFGNTKGSEKPSIIANGFADMKPFQNALYLSTSGKGFENYGVIQWLPTVLTDDNGNFRFNVPGSEKRTVRIKIEGITSDGKLISEIKTIAL